MNFLTVLPRCVGKDGVVLCSQFCEPVGFWGTSTSSGRGWKFRQMSAHLASKTFWAIDHQHHTVERETSFFKSWKRISLSKVSQLDLHNAKLGVPTWVPWGTVVRTRMHKMASKSMNCSISLTWQAMPWSASRNHVQNTHKSSHKALMYVWFQQPRKDLVELSYGCKLNDCRASSDVNLTPTGMSQHGATTNGTLQCAFTLEARSSESLWVMRLKRAVRIRRFLSGGPNVGRRYSNTQRTYLSFFLAILTAESEV